MATKQQIPVLAGAIVSKQEGFAALPDKDAQWAIENTDEAIRLAVMAIQDRNFIKPRSNIQVGIEDQLKLWQELYKLYFGLENVKMINPERPNPSVRFKQLVVVAKGITLNDVIKAMRTTKMKIWSYSDDLNSAVATNERTADKGHYAIYVRDTIEADEDLRDTSANEIAKKKTATMTLLERLLLELFIFHWTGEHLDVKNVTLCAGSRDSVGGVPYVGWLAGRDRVRISWCYADDSSGNLRARAVHQFVG